MSLLDDCWIKYINLAHRTDRREHMEKELARIGIKAERFEAIKTSDHPFTPWKTDTMMRRTPGAVGCWYSQVRVLAEAYQLGLHGFVMEDDLIIASDFYERIAYLEKFLEGKSFDVLWLGGTVHLNPPYWHGTGHKPEIQCNCTLNKDAECTDDPRIIRTYGAFSTYSYIVHKDSILKILTRLDEVINHSIGIDAAFIEIAPELTCYMFLPGICKQKDNRSDIGQGDTLFSNFAQLGSYWWSDNMSNCDFNPLTFDFGEAKIKYK